MFFRVLRWDGIKVCSTSVGTVAFACAALSVSLALFAPMLVVWTGVGSCTMSWPWSCPASPPCCWGRRPGPSTTLMVPWWGMSWHLHSALLVLIARQQQRFRPGGDNAGRRKNQNFACMYVIIYVITLHGIDTETFLRMPFFVWINMNKTHEK